MQEQNITSKGALTETLANQCVSSVLSVLNFKIQNITSKGALTETIQVIVTIIPPICKTLHQRAPLLKQVAREEPFL